MIKGLESIEVCEMDGHIIIEVRDLNKSFETDGRVVAIDSLNLDVYEGELLSILGPTGCGKTTLLRIIAGFEQPTSGRVLLNGKEVRESGSDRGVVFQEFALFPWRTVKKNIEFGLEIKGLAKEKREEISQKYIDLVGLAGFENAYPKELSGGMKQRVGIARALANDPMVLLMDEPFGSLDAQTRNFMQRELLDIWVKTKKTIIFVTHSVDEAVYLADRIMVMTARPGRVKTITDVSMLKRPRDRTGAEVVQVRGRVLRDLEAEVERTWREQKMMRYEERKE